MPSKTSLEAVNTAGPFINEYELGQQAGVASPRDWVVESVGAGRGMVPNQIYVPDFWIGT